MPQEEFNAMLPPISDSLVAMIAEKRNLTEKDAMMQLYQSSVYALLEKEETKLWHYSTEMLYALFEQEKTTGTLTFPDV